MENDKDDTFNEQFADVNETINQGNVATGDTADGNVIGSTDEPGISTLKTATTDAAAAFKTATSFGGLSDPLAAEKQKDRDDLIGLVRGGATQFQSTAEFQAQENIDPEDPDTIPDDVLSEDENYDNLLALDPDLEDPEMSDGLIVTLGAQYPGKEPSLDAIAKDPEPNPRDVEERTGIQDRNEIDGIIQYCQALNYHKRKIYLHSALLKKDLKSTSLQNMSYTQLKQLLERAEHSKFYLDRIHEKLTRLCSFTPGQSTSRTCANKNLESNIITLRKAVELSLCREIERAERDAIRAQQDLNATLAQVDAAKIGSSTAANEPSAHTAPQPQVNNQTTSTPSRPTVVPPGLQPGGQSNSNPAGFQNYSFGIGDPSRSGPGNSHNFGYGNYSWSRQGRGGRGGGRGAPRGGGNSGNQGPPGAGQGGLPGLGGGGGNNPSQPPPFQPPGNNPNAGPYNQQFVNMLAQAIKFGTRPDDKLPNYRGIEKPKIDSFDGDVIKYRQWKSAFEIMYTPDRNLPKDHLATALIGLLKGEAKRSVLAHVTLNKNGTDYKAMWDHLDRRYGSPHVQAKCIRDKANQILYLDTLSLKTVLAFYEAVVVQFKYYEVEQPHAIRDENSHLFLSLKEKMSDKIVDKYIDYLDADYHDEPLPRTVTTLLNWLEKTISRLQEVEITSRTSKLRTTRSPSRQIKTGTVDSGDVTDFDIDDASEYDSDENPNHSVTRTTVAGEKMHYNFKKNKYYKPRKYPGEATTTAFANPKVPVAKAFKPSPDKTEYAKLIWPNKICYLCKTVEHELIDCNRFKKLPVSQRYTAVARSGSCYHCLRRGHRIADCQSNPQLLCGVNGCDRHEHPLIHADKSANYVHYGEWSFTTHGPFPDIEADNEPGPSDHSSNTLQLSEQSAPKHVINMLHFQTNMTTLRVAAKNAISIQTVVCSISSRVNKVGKRIVAMLDSGSNTTCIDEALAKSLRCKRKSETTEKSVSMLSGVKILESYLCEIMLTSGDGLTTQIIFAHTIKDMTDNTTVVDWSKAKKNFKHLHDIPFDAVKKDAKISLLIGSDNAHLFSITDGTLREGERGEPIAYRTPLGWTCLGPTEKPDTDGNAIHNILLSRLPKPKSK